MIHDFESLKLLLDHFVNALEHPKKDADYPRQVCEMSRMILMRCVMAEFGKETGWDAATAEKAVRALQKAINVQPGSIFQNNIAERAQTLTELIQKSQTLRASHTSRKKARTKPFSAQDGEGEGRFART